MSRSDLYDNLPDSLMDYTPGYSFRFHQDGKVLLLLVDDCVSLLEPIITEGGKRVAGERRFLTPAGKKALLELLRNIFGPKVRPRC